MKPAKIIYTLLREALLKNAEQFLLISHYCIYTDDAGRGHNVNGSTPYNTSVRVPFPYFLSMEEQFHELTQSC
jgi:hypothetical protein